jgi:hypothetical protein
MAELGVDLIGNTPGIFRRHQGGNPAMGGG